MTSPTKAQDKEIIRTWPNEWTGQNQPPGNPELVKQFQQAAKKADRKSVEMLRKDS